MNINSKMVEAALGMLARFIPPEEYSKIAGALNDLTAQGQAIEARAQKIEVACEQLVGIRGELDQLVKTFGYMIDQVHMLETIVRNNVEGAAVVYAERDAWLREGNIEKALAPAVEGSLNDHH